LATPQRRSGAPRIAAAPAHINESRAPATSCRGRARPGAARSDWQPGQRYGRSRPLPCPGPDRPRTAAGTG